jgi:cation transport ATPase
MSLKPESAAAKGGAVRKLMDLKPASAHVIRESQDMEVPAESVQQ